MAPNRQPGGSHYERIIHEIGGLNLTDFVNCSDSGLHCIVAFGCDEHVVKGRIRDYTGHDPL